MNRRPRRRSENITDRGFLDTMFFTGFLGGRRVCGLHLCVEDGNYGNGLQLYLRRAGLCRTIAFFGARSETKPVWRIALFTNANLVLVVAVSF